MLPRLVPEILSKCAFCDGVGVGAAGVGIGDSRSLIESKLRLSSKIGRSNQQSEIIGSVLVIVGHMIKTL